MKLKMVTISILPMIILLSGQIHAEESKAEAKRIMFNRLSLEVQDGWKFSVNPEAPSGTDQIRLYSEDTKRTLLITLTNERKDISLVEAVQNGGRMLVSRAVSIPEFSGCTVNGSGQDPQLWGRTGVVVLFNVIKESSKDAGKPVMKIYNMGERLAETGEVLFLAAFIIGDEKNDIEKIVRSIGY